MPVEDVFSIKGRGTVGHRSYRARQVVNIGDKLARGRWHQARRTSEDDLHRRRDVQQDAAMTGRSRRQRRPAACAAWTRTIIERGMVLCKTGFDQPAHRVRGRGLCPQQGRRWPSHAVLQQLPSAVLHAHDRRHRHDRADGWRRDVHAGRQRHDEGDADQPGGDAKRSSASPSAKVAAPSAPAPSPRSSSRAVFRVPDACEGRLAASGRFGSRESEAMAKSAQCGTRVRLAAVHRVRAT